MARKNKLYSFLAGEGANSKGIYLKDIWKWNIEKLEKEHDYIQWMFPVYRRSRFNIFAPTLKKSTIEQFRNNEKIKENMIKSLDVMLKFYGFELVQYGDIIDISTDDNFKDRERQWITERNHNFLRLTRMLKSLKILGLEDYSKELLSTLERIYNYAGNEYIIGSKTLRYWRCALEN